MNSNLNRALEWTTTGTQPVILGFLSLLALVFFSAAAWPKLKTLMNAKSADRTNQMTLIMYFRMLTRRPKYLIFQTFYIQKYRYGSKNMPKCV